MYAQYIPAVLCLGCSRMRLTHRDVAHKTHTAQKCHRVNRVTALDFDALGVDRSWRSVLQSVAAQLREVLAKLAAQRAAGVEILPPAPLIFRALQQPAQKVRVVILGQDPYPTPGHAVGLAFSVAKDVRPLPASLRNIYKELHADLGIAPALHGDLSAWEKRGVLLLNTALTVPAGNANGHRALGWEPIAAAVLQYLAQLHAAGQPLVAVLWGNHAKAYARFLPGVPTVTGVHPSPLAASRGFFGSRPFSAINSELRSQGAEPIDWQLPSEALF